MLYLVLHSDFIGPLVGPSVPDSAPSHSRVRGSSGTGSASDGFPKFQPPSSGRFDSGSGDRRSGFGGGDYHRRDHRDRDSGDGRGSRYGGSFSGGRGGSGGGGYGGGRAPSSRDLDHVALPRQDFRNLVTFEKNFYVENRSVTAMSENDVAQYRAKREITVEGQDVPRPIRMFSEANFPGT